MDTNRTARILRFVAGVLGVLVLGYLSVIALVLWEFRTHTYTIHDVPNAFTDDEATLQLSASVLLLHGVDPSSYTPGTFWGGATVGHNSLNPNRVTTCWISHTPGTHGLGVALEQNGHDVVCYVTRSK